jgi:hypothetical protein
MKQLNQKFKVGLETALNFLERLSKFSLDLRFKVDGIANLINFNLNPNETTKSEV